MLFVVSPPGDQRYVYGSTPPVATTVAVPSPVPGPNSSVEEMERLSSAGFRLLNTEPKRGADNKLVCFIHPKSANGVLVELCQSI